MSSQDNSLKKLSFKKRQFCFHLGHCIWVCLFLNLCTYHNFIILFIWWLTNIVSQCLMHFFHKVSFHFSLYKSWKLLSLCKSMVTLLDQTPDFFLLCVMWQWGFDLNLLSCVPQVLQSNEITWHTHGLIIQPDETSHLHT